MRALLRALLTPLAVSVLAMAAATGAVAQTMNPAEPPPAPQWMQHWEADHKALLNAKLAGLKAGLQLSPDQEKLWGPFEAAVRDAANMRMQHMQEMMERMPNMRMERMDHMDQMDHMDEMGMDMGGGPGSMSPIDRLDAMANRLTEAGGALKNVAAAGKPLYASLDDSQKRIFGFLAREMMAMGGPDEMGAHWRHHPHHEGEGGSDEE